MEHKHIEYPEELQPKYEKAKKLEWLSVTYILSVIVLMYLALGQSQAMKTAWADDTLGIISPVAFLICSRLFTKKPNKQFPYGYHRVTTIAYLCGSLALQLLGIYLFTDAVLKLLNQERPSIGMINIFNHQIWLGYLMIAALIWSTLPAYFLGKAKLAIASDLHEKVLYADAATNKADWVMGVAAMAGIIGIGIGWWWADSAIALLLSVDIIYDGFKNLKQAVFDLMNQVPKTVSEQEDDPITERLQDMLSQLQWVKQVKVRIREEGHVFYGEALIIPNDTSDILLKIKEANNKACGMDWRIIDFVIGIVDDLKAYT